MIPQIPYLVAGDPNLDTTAVLLNEMSKYCEAIVLAFPFSDPIAGGALLQKAHVRALENVIHTKHIFSLLRDFQNQNGCPIIVELYYNQIFTYGIEDFFRQAKDCGIRALHILDLPIEHEPEILPYAKYHQIILLHSLSASANRAKLILPRSEGALICDNEQAANLARQSSELPCLQELHDLDEPRYGDAIIVKEPLIDLIEALSIDPHAQTTVLRQIQSLLLY